MNMKQIDDLLTTLAREHLHIETLETRRSDSLDFHEVSVWGVKDALHAAYQAGENDRTGNRAPDPSVLQEALEALERAEFLMRRVHGGDHRALRGLPAASRQANRARSRLTSGIALAQSSPRLPIVTVTVRGGLIEDIDATIPADVVVEDWDVPDFDTDKRPARNVWTLTGSLSARKAARLRRLIAEA
jgi:hypothetical protein